MCFPICDRSIDHMSWVWINWGYWRGRRRLGNIQSSIMNVSSTSLSRHDISLKRPIGHIQGFFFYNIGFTVSKSYVEFRRRDQSCRIDKHGEPGQLLAVLMADTIQHWMGCSSLTVRSAQARDTAISRKCLSMVLPKLVSMSLICQLSYHFQAACPASGHLPGI